MAGWFLAPFYDRILGPAEQRGLGAMRRSVLEEVGGDVLEIGAGNGLNLRHYTSAVRSLTLCEPDGGMRRQLQAKLDAGELGPGRSATVHAVGGERLPVADDSMDAVVCTLVLCTVQDVEQTLAEARRVLKPGGSFHFVEHIGGPAGSRRLRWQSRVEPLWKLVAGGCHLTRQPGPLIEASGLRIERLEPGRMPGANLLIHDRILGRATKA